MTTGLSTPGANERLGFRVDGMDCASCVGKIETALGRLGGISDVAVNFATETLLLSRDATSKTTSKDIAKKIRTTEEEIEEKCRDEAAQEVIRRPTVELRRGGGG